MRLRVSVRRYLRTLYNIRVPLFYSTSKARHITNRISENYIADKLGVRHVPETSRREKIMF